MISAQRLIDAARARGFAWYSGVPCSFLNALIERIERAPGFHYVPATNEGDAVAMAAGATLAGQRGVVFMQNSGLGNAVNPLASLTWPFRIPVLLLISLRGDPAFGDEPQHRLMGQITSQLLRSLEIPFEVVPAGETELEAALDRASGFLESERRPYALIVRRDTFAAEPPRCSPGPGPAPSLASEPIISSSNAIPDARPTRRAVLERLIELTPPERSVLIATTGYTGRELLALQDRPNQFYLVGSMGCASSLGLGLALVRPDLHVVIADGDGAALMRMGSLACIGAHAGSNLTHIVLDNEAHESTGAQPTVSGHVSFAGVAAACGYAHAWSGTSLDALESCMHEAARPGSITGPRLLHLKIRLGTPAGLPRPKAPAEDLCARFVHHLASPALSEPVARSAQ